MSLGEGSCCALALEPVAAIMKEVKIATVRANAMALRVAVIVYTVTLFLSLARGC